MKRQTKYTPKNLVMEKLQHNTEYKSLSRNIQNASLLFNSKSWCSPLGGTGTCLTPQNHKDDKWLLANLYQIGRSHFYVHFQFYWYMQDHRGNSYV